MTKKKKNSKESKSKSLSDRNIKEEELVKAAVEV